MFLPFAHLLICSSARHDQAPPLQLPVTSPVTDDTNSEYVAVSAPVYITRMHITSWVWVWMITGMHNVHLWQLLSISFIRFP